MGFLKKAAKEEDSSDESSQLEEQYMKLFPKIGRDFVHVEDLIALISQIMGVVDPFDFNPLSLDNAEACQRAYEYKEFLDSDKAGSKIYKDLINLDEDGDSE